MNPTCPCQTPKSQPQSGPVYLGLPQQSVILVDADTAAEIRTAMAQVKQEGLIVGGPSGVVVGLVLGVLLAAFVGRWNK